MNFKLKNDGNQGPLRVEENSYLPYIFPNVES